MSSQKHLDPRAQAAVQHLSAYPGDWAGAIRPKLITAALPPRSSKRGWCDFIAHAVLEEIISAHRPKKSGEVFFNGALYRVTRRDLARQLCTSPDEISSALTWLEALGVIGRVERTLIDEDGQPRGKQIFAYPIMPVLQEFLDEYRKTGKTPEPFSVTPRRAGLTSAKSQVDPVEEAGSQAGRTGNSPNCAQAQRKHAEGVGDTSSQRPARIVGDGPRSRVEDGGVEDADQNKAHVSPVPSAAPPPLADGTPSTTTHPTAPPPPASIKLDDEEAQTAWKNASRFCTLWAQAIMRLNHVTTCSPTSGDLKAALQFFLDHPQTESFYTVAVATDAWALSLESKQPKWDRLFHVRHSLDLPSFLRTFASEKLESEVGRFMTINAWADLRTCFTQSELVFYGWPAAKIPIVGLEPDDIWENLADAPTYYRDRKLPFPREVVEAEDCRRILEQERQK